MSGIMFTGSSADGSDMRPTKGMFINPDNENEFSNMPYDKAQKQEARNHDTFWDIHNKIEKSYAEEYKLIKLKTSTLSRKEREFVVKTVEENEKSSISNSDNI